jgi:hypothetical protein
MVGTLVVVAFLLAATVAVPHKGSSRSTHTDLPSVALGQESVYRVEVFLVVFYAGLLILTPVFWGLVGGRLPTEISARGAKFAEEATGSIEETRKLVEELRERVSDGEAKAARARLNVDQIAAEAEVKLRD